MLTKQRMEFPKEIWSNFSLYFGSSSFYSFTLLFLTFTDSVTLFLFKVIPSLREKHDEFVLRELVKRWPNHKIMVWWLLRFLHSLDRYFIARTSLPALKEVGLLCFRDRVTFICIPSNLKQLLIFSTSSLFSCHLLSSQTLL